MGRVRDDWRSQQADDMHNQVARILDYFDGNALVQQDLPPDTSPPTDAPDMRDASIGLLSSQDKA